MQHSATIFSANSTAKALQQVLETCYNWQVLVHDEKPLGNNGDRVPISSMGPDFIIALPDMLPGPSEVIGMIHHLRSERGWEGTFIAVVKDREEHEEIERASLTGDDLDVVRFSKVAGHVALYEPCQLKELFAVLSTPTDVSQEYWLALCNASELAQLPEKIKRAREAHRGEAEAATREVLEAFLSIVWSSHKSDHSVLYKIHECQRELQKQYPTDQPLNSKDVLDIIDQIAYFIP